MQERFCNVKHIRGSEAESLCPVHGHPTSQAKSGTKKKQDPSVIVTSKSGSNPVSDLLMEMTGDPNPRPLTVDPRDHLIAQLDTIYKVFPSNTEEVAESVIDWMKDVDDPMVIRHAQTKLLNKPSVGVHGENGPIIDAAFELSGYADGAYTDVQLQEHLEGEVFGLVSEADDHTRSLEGAPVPYRSNSYRWAAEDLYGMLGIALRKTHSEDAAAHRLATLAMKASETSPMPVLAMVYANRSLVFTNDDLDVMQRRIEETGSAEDILEFLKMAQGRTYTETTLANALGSVARVKARTGNTPGASSYVQMAIAVSNGDLDQVVQEAMLRDSNLDLGGMVSFLSVDPNKDSRILQVAIADALADTEARLQVDFGGGSERSRANRAVERNARLNVQNALRRYAHASLRDSASPFIDRTLALETILKHADAQTKKLMASNLGGQNQGEIGMAITKSAILGQDRKGAISFLNAMNDAHHEHRDGSRPLSGWSPNPEQTEQIEAELVSPDVDTAVRSVWLSNPNANVPRFQKSVSEAVGPAAHISMIYKQATRPESEEEAHPGWDTPSHTAYKNRLQEIDWDFAVADAIQSKQPKTCLTLAKIPAEANGFDVKWISAQSMSSLGRIVFEFGGKRQKEAMVQALQQYLSRLA